MDDELKKLKDADVYSLSLFVLYKLIDVKEYSIIGELPYILNKRDLINFCNYFGGRTIKVPTLGEMNSMLNLILLYQYVNIEGKRYEDAIKIIGFSDKQKRNLKTAYNKVCEVLENYNFGKK